MIATERIPSTSERYPKLLKEIYDPPPLLMARGCWPRWEESDWIAVVGARKVTSFGKKKAYEIGAALAGAGCGVVSGLAYGIDTIVHKASIKNNIRTIAIPGSGLDKKVLYPKENHNLADEIIKNGGALISEFTWDYPASTYTFPQRNRIIAGLSRGVLVIEAPEKSGALITAKCALDMNRDVGVVPGEITSIMSRGSNNLLKYGAFPILKAEDALEILGVKNNSDFAVQYFFDEDEKRIIENINESVSINELFDKTGIDLKTLNQKITMLEIKGAVECLSGQVKVLKRKPL